MTRLSSPVEQIGDHYAVVVVGSGYGGGIAASRLARAGQRVCVLERGRELQPGEYPDTELEAVAQMQAHSLDGHVGSRTGLFDFHISPDINVLVGCGLGGTSLINANVSLRADPRVFQDSVWPEELRKDLHSLLEEGYGHSEAMLKPIPYPNSTPLNKLEALQRSARALNKPFKLPPINVTFETGVNVAGVHQEACILCGDCVSGCNHRAKNTTLMNYLPDAWNHGAEIYTQVCVRQLERAGNGWRVHYQILDTGRERFDAPTLFVNADLVVLAAGVLGSTEILLRSRQTLTLSGQLGHRFSSNGDVLGFTYDGASPIDGIGFGARSPKGRTPVGPCITGFIDMRDAPNLNDGMIIEEGSIPGALAGFLPAAFAASAAALGVNPSTSEVGEAEAKARETESLLLGAYHGAVENTQTYLVMTHDSGDGEMVLEGDNLAVRWPGVGREPIFQKVNETLRKATVPLEGVYVENPIWSKLTNRNLITVHPLGGCVMAEDAEHGVVNHKNQVFSGRSGTAVYENLYVMDGSVVPRPLGVNPLLTISALAERSCAILAKERGWSINYQLPSAPRTVAVPSKVGIQFTERMSGYFSSAVKDANYLRGEAQGKADKSSLEFTLTIASNDLDDMLSNPNHAAKMAGTVIAPSLSPRPLTVTEGVFNLFRVNPDQVETDNMIYRMKMTSEEGKTFFFSGFKTANTSPATRSWPELSTLYITVYQGNDDKAPVVGCGILHIQPSDFLKQMTTLQVTNAQSLQQRLEATDRFGRFFAGVCWQSYAGIFAGPSVFNRDAAPRKKRMLRVSAPEVYPVPTSDGVEIRLTRYPGGSKGPVILSHGLGVSSLIFTIDTIDTNLLEYLYANGYDVWLLDSRASIALPAAKLQSSGDDIATKDYPAAVQKVREITGVANVQMVVHCWGSTTFTMAMLAGLEGVRSAVCSQISANIVAAAPTRIKTGLHLASFLDDIGVHSLSAYVDNHAGLLSKIYDGGLEIYADALTQRCRDASCHRITFMYAPLYQHSQLNEATHDALPEMFGVANMRAFEHLQRLTNTGHLVDVNGEEVYMPHLDRLAIPICFIHGAENECFLPRSTEITYNLLRAKNNPALYTRHVIPGYGHIDCIFGDRAARDVYPLILQHLETTNTRAATARGSSSR
ncbi:MAG: alpha/beta fold hydrolase [Terriglobia bacterium]